MSDKPPIGKGEEWTFSIPNKGINLHFIGADAERSATSLAENYADEGATATKVENSSTGAGAERRGG